MAEIIRSAITVVGSFEVPQLAPRILRWLRQASVLLLLTLLLFVSDQGRANESELRGIKNKRVGLCIWITEGICGPDFETYPKSRIASFDVRNLIYAQYFRENAVPAYNLSAFKGGMSIQCAEAGWLGQCHAPRRAGAYYGDNFIESYLVTSGISECETNIGRYAGLARLVQFHSFEREKRPQTYQQAILGGISGNLRCFGGQLRSLNRTQRIDPLFVRRVAQPGSFDEKAGGSVGEYGSKDYQQNVREFEFKKGLKRTLLMVAGLSSCWTGLRLDSSGALWCRRLGLVLCIAGPVGILVGWGLV
jgi:hypothetical protein